MVYKFILESSAEPKVIGVKDGSYQIRLSDVNVNDSNLKRFLFNDNKPWPDLRIDNLSSYEQDLNFNLRKQAKLTDFVDYSPYIHIVGVFSERFVDLLKTFHLHESIIFKEIYIFKNDLKIGERYFIIQQPNIDTFGVDWESTLFYKPLYRMIEKNEFCYKFSSYKDYLENLVSIKISKLSLKQHQCFTYDFISVLTNHFVSDRLARAIEKENFTNIILKNIESVNCSDIILYK